jgi:hypothetical protein
MACPICPAAGWVGGWIGGYFGVKPPEHPGGRILSALVTANLMSITVIALKALFDVSLCVGGVTLGNFIRVGVKAAIMGIVYSIGVNYLLNRYIFSQSNPLVNDSILEEKDALPCCCKRDLQEAEVKKNQTTIPSIFNRESFANYFRSIKFSPMDDSKII